MRVQVTFDAHNPRALAVFWAVALHYKLEDPSTRYETWEAYWEETGALEDPWLNSAAIVPKDGQGVRIRFQKVSEAKAAKNRMNFDVEVAPGLEGEKRMAVLEAKSDELSDYGATRIKRTEATDTRPGFLIMEDPEGNVFCLI
ncbi:VOC family protein [Flaviflexus massiliensis]|uniref:VOC family protein n=1 Tax=Flaviflexus massiliensis TaxID=1522309 RepID=UPI0006D57D09|nr:VOC family protein [Flaviflexus massiliensis]